MLRLAVALLATVGFSCLAGCSAAWNADRVSYTGRPGLIIEVQAGTFSVYIGPPGETELEGKAGGRTADEAAHSPATP